MSDAFTTGSSIMPQKKNPDAAELIRAKVGRILGSLTSLTVVMKGLPLAYSKDMQEDKVPTFEAFDALELSLLAMTGMVADLEPNLERMAAAAGAGFSTATDLADALDALLPQTQCTRCGYPDCRAYAEAMAAGQAEINQCPPGGEEGIRRLALATGRHMLPLNPANGLEAPRTVARVDETWCIGCTLCIKACPVDCIVLVPVTGAHTGWSAWSPEQAATGQWVQTSLLQAQIFMLDFQAARWLMEQDVATQAGNNHPTSIPTGVFKTSDGFINIATTGGKIWERCAQSIGAPELITDPDYATAPARSKNRDALGAEINARTAQNTTEYWVTALNAAGVPCGPIYAIDQMFADEQVKHLGIAQDVPNDQGREITLVGQPFTLSRTPSTMAARPPEFGEQTDEVLAEFGFSGEEIAALHRGKVV
eukprot:gene29842-39593_t